MSRLVSALLAGLLLLGGCGEGPARAPDLSIHRRGPPDRPTWVLPLPPGEGPPPGRLPEGEGRAWLALRVAGSPQPVVGRYERTDEGIAFTPSFRLLPGRTYELDARGSTTGLPYRVPEVELPPPAEVLEVHPDVEVLPANHLKFYFVFSQPMRGGEEIFSHLHLRDLDRGEEVAAAWRVLPLWTPDHRQLTVLIHPGRVKTGLRYRRALGPVLREGGRFEVVLDAGARDAWGRPLARPFRRTWRVGPEDRDWPRPERWELTPPEAGGTGPLVLTFDEPMDHELVVTELVVWGPDGRRVPGRVVLEAGERVARFLPDVPWAPAPHRLRVGDGVADLAGNTPIELFDAPSARKRRPGTVELERVFTPR